MEIILLLVGFGVTLMGMLWMTGAIVNAIKSRERSLSAENEEITVLVVFHCVAWSGGEIFQSEECVIKGIGSAVLNVRIMDQKRELAEKYQRPIIVHQIVKL